MAMPMGDVHAVPRIIDGVKRYFHIPVGSTLPAPGSNPIAPAQATGMARTYADRNQLIRKALLEVSGRPDGPAPAEPPQPLNWTLPGIRPPVGRAFRGAYGRHLTEPGFFPRLSGENALIRLFRGLF